MSKLNKKKPCFFLLQKKVKNKNALGVTFLQAKNTRVQLATYAPTLEYEHSFEHSFEQSSAITHTFL